MRVFLSWSGQTSLQVARALQNWLPNVLPSVETWMSEEDITMGSRWAHALADELEQTKACVVCLTSDNLNSTWLHFEAGEVAKVVDQSFVCPYLKGIKKNELVGPLSLFQSAVADREDTLRLVRTLNESTGGSELPAERLNKVFEVWWPHLEAELEKIELYPHGLFDVVKHGIVALIDSSNLPMYFLDSELVVQHCNDHFASLIDSEATAVVGEHVSELIGRFAQRVPETRRAPFLEMQRKLVNRVESDLGPHTEAVDYVDNRALLGSRYEGLYRVWIHADKIRAQKGGDYQGVFVVYRVERLSDEAEIPELAH
jgi:hypothetical protein